MLVPLCFSLGSRVSCLGEVSSLQFWLHESMMEEIRAFNQARVKTSYIFVYLVLLLSFIWLCLTRVFFQSFRDLRCMCFATRRFLLKLVFTTVHVSFCRLCGPSFFASFDCNPLRISQDIAGAITSKPSFVVSGEFARGCL